MGRRRKMVSIRKEDRKQDNKRKRSSIKKSDG